ncbi:hypothetical protein [Pseudomonas sp.]|uniref:hypothetical protein n=1 Tax=Pseudomonas sp. TaxID=306 RepID=UPI003A97B390
MIFFLREKVARSAARGADYLATGKRAHPCSGTTPRHQHLQQIVQQIRQGNGIRQLS